ncbi:MAG: Mrp/NBP35 family ATP-binding protein [Vampirovibrionales bacterium]|nr:Mrp/NBP35 family ATP-binding protein [Vampirovibrionales bacterium]
MSELPTPTQEQILDAIKDILPADKIDNIAACDGIVRLDVILESTQDPKRAELFETLKTRIMALPGVNSVNPGISTKTPAARGFGQPAQSPAPKPVQQTMPFKHIIAVSSGKGGVGKTTVTVNLACALAKLGHKVGILDADIYGPNVAIMMGLRGYRLKPNPDTQTFEMPENHGVQVISMAFLMNEEQPVVWRGPMLDKAIRQFLTDMPWHSDLDYLLIDLPPGTGDAQLTVMQAVPMASAIIVTTPQDVAIHDSKKGLAMFQNNGMNVLGLIENMSYFICEHGSRYELFGNGGGKKAAEALNIPFLGEIPLVAEQRAKADEGLPVVVYDAEGEQAKRFITLAERVIGDVVAHSEENEPKTPVGAH